MVAGTQEEVEQRTWRGALLPILVAVEVGDWTW